MCMICIFGAFHRAPFPSRAIFELVSHNYCVVIHFQILINYYYNYFNFIFLFIYFYSYFYYF